MILPSRPGNDVRVISFHPVEVTDDVTGQVKVKMFDFSGLVTLASTISMLSANKANESAWIVSLMGSEKWPVYPFL